VNTTLNEKELHIPALPLDEGVTCIPMAVANNTCIPMAVYCQTVDDPQLRIDFEARPALN